MSTPDYPQPAAAAAAQPVPTAFLAPAAGQPVYEQPYMPHPQAQPQPLPQIQAVQSVAPSVQVPEGGYAQRITTIKLPQFHLQGLPEPWIEMRNPGLMASETIDEISRGLRGISVGDDGEPTAADAEVIKTTMLKVLRRWCIWDARSEADVPPLLPATPTVEGLSYAPLGVIGAIGAAFRELQNPQ